jgi:hypothetical protein
MVGILTAAGTATVVGTVITAGMVIAIGTAATGIDLRCGFDAGDVARIGQIHAS